MGASSAVNLGGMLNQIAGVLGDPSGGLAITDAMKAVNEREAEKAKQKKMMEAFGQANEIAQQGMAGVQTGDPRAVQAAIDRINKAAAGAQDPAQQARLLELSNQLQGQLPTARKVGVSAAAQSVMAMDKEIANYEKAMADPVQKLYMQQNPDAQKRYEDAQKRYEVFKARRETLMARPEIQQELTSQKMAKEEALLKHTKAQLQVKDMQIEQEEKVIGQQVAKVAQMMADNPDMPIPPQLAAYEKDILTASNAIANLRDQKAERGYVKPIDKDVIAAASGANNPIIDEAIKRYESGSFASQAEKKHVIDTIYTGAEGYIGQIKDQKARVAEAKGALRVETLKNLTQTEGFMNAKQDFWEKLRDLDPESDQYKLLTELAIVNADKPIEQFAAIVLDEMSDLGVNVTPEAERLIKNIQENGRMEALVEAKMKENPSLTRKVAEQRVKNDISEQLASKAIKSGNIN